MDKLLRKIHIGEIVMSTIAYANNLALVIGGSSRDELVGKASAVMFELDARCKEYKICEATNNTHNALMKGNLLWDPVVRMRGEFIRRSETTTCMGIVLHEKRTFFGHVEGTSGRASRKIQKIVSMATREKKMPLGTMNIYMTAVMASIAGYGANVWEQRLLLVKPKAEVRARTIIRCRADGGAGNRSLLCKRH